MPDIFDVCENCKYKMNNEEEQPCDECQFLYDSGYTQFVWDEGE